ncbi:S-layer homology domain-containing protein [Paenibacillus sp. V4I7]|uniref:S-layer homology domain-containing protein n=1 Tax=Paenibacillus sp. V4I7 TaxID=3042307 RepID=UPI00359484A8
MGKGTGNIYFYCAIASILQKDYSRASDYFELAERYIPERSSAIKKLGLIEGTGTYQFNPNAQATRAEAVTVLLKMLVLENK